MKLIITTEQHFWQLPDGSIWSSGSINRDYFLQFLGNFQSIAVVARVRGVSNLPKNTSRVDSNQISFISLPDWRGPISFMKNYYLTLNILRKELPESAAYLLVMPSIISITLYKFLKKQPYGVHVVGDPEESFFGRISLFFYFSKIFFTHWQKKICAQSVVAIYVAKSLKNLYPTKTKTGSVVVSDIIIDSEDVVRQPRGFVYRPKRLIFIGTLSQLYKGQMTLIDALSICKKRKFKFFLKIIGGGVFSSKLKAKSIKNNLRKEVKFLGQLNGFSEIKNYLDMSDIFILPSFNEGMPRALIEAMARGLVCIASNVGGIPELLNRDFLVRPRDKMALANKIIEISGLDPKALENISRSNISTAQRFLVQELKKRRDPYLKKIKTLTENYLKTSH